MEKNLENVMNEYVEIGGVKWATMNVGANAITDSGLYFQWGDTQGYTAKQALSEKAFSEDDYKFGDSDTFTKYNEIDGKATLDSEDDMVTAAWGGDWRMPTKEEFETLCESTTSEWVDNYLGSGVSGRLFTDKTDSSKTLFFPSVGYCEDCNVWEDGSDGYYWSRSLNADNENGACYLCFYYSYVNTEYNYYRYQGYSVRGVLGE